ncbi:hypothetical protein ACFQ7N_39385 [Streptomyces niveus]|uniref:hypothetical protein n=1 Tax=Streptomyces niveus TaxID=193462 RepID=UPI0036A249CD
MRPITGSDVTDFYNADRDLLVLTQGDQLAYVNREDITDHFAERASSYDYVTTTDGKARVLLTNSTRHDSIGYDPTQLLEADGRLSPAVANLMAERINDYLAEESRRLAARQAAAEVPRPFSTILGGWGNYCAHATVEESARAALGDAADNYNIDGIARDWRQAVNDALPKGVTLSGVAFTGPEYPEYPPESLEIDAVISGVDFQAIADRHRVRNP